MNEQYSISTSALKEYLERVLSLERSIYLQKNVIGTMQAKLRAAENPEYKTTSYHWPHYLPKWVFLFPFVIIPVIHMVLIAVFSAIGNESVADLLTDGILSKVFIASGFISFYAIIAYDIYAKISSVRKEKMDRKEVANYNNNLTAFGQQRAVAINQEINRAMDELKKTNAVLQRVYSMNIIYPKYRNFAAVGMFYEYMCAGRCNRLEGHEGAYNIYEYELRMNIIIDELREIKQNQWYLYDAISEENERFSQLYNTCLNGMDRLENISQNSDLISYYSRIEANDINTIKWMKIFHY